MNEHTLRILERIKLTCGRFLRNDLTNDALLHDVEGLCGALEDKEASLLIQNFIVNIEDSRHLFEEVQGQVFLSEKIKDLFDSMEHLA
ncbi:MAG: hypothetical protein OWT28_10390 [Firmicutes bacterium]|nr:hypothetical protein [Bacillota bacterium]